MHHVKRLSGGRKEQRTCTKVEELREHRQRRVVVLNPFNVCSGQEEVMVLERILLQTIKFDLQVEHPYQFLLKYAKQLKGKETEGVSVGLLLGFSSASDGTQDFCMLDKCSTLKPHPQLFFFFFLKTFHSEIKSF